MQTQTILFNLDDTLIYCNRYFNRVSEIFLHQMAEWFNSLSAEEIRQKQLEIDLKTIDKYGLLSDRFPESFVDTYEYFCSLTGKEKKKREIDSLRELGLSVFKIPVEPVPFMDETLKQLKAAGHKLYLHTGGDEPNQQRKITQLELTTYFEHRIFISTYKDTSALSDILKTIRADPNVTWMVGNSLRTDIKPALEMHINAIYIPAETPWEFDIVDVNVKNKRTLFTLKSLQDVPETIHRHVLKHEGIRGLLLEQMLPNKKEKGKNRFI